MNLLSLVCPPFIFCGSVGNKLTRKLLKAHWLVLKIAPTENKQLRINRCLFSVVYWCLFSSQVPIHPSAGKAVVRWGQRLRLPLPPRLQPPLPSQVLWTNVHPLHAGSSKAAIRWRVGMITALLISICSLLFFDISSQMVWASSNKVGCAVHTCHNMNVWGSVWKRATYLVCNYSPK